MVQTRASSLPRRVRPLGLAGAARGNRSRVPAAVALVCALGVTVACDRLHECRLPPRLADLPLTLSYREGAPLEQTRRLYGIEIGARSGAFGSYGGGAASVLVVSTRDTTAAEQMVRDMTARIAREHAAFRPDTLDAGGRSESLRGAGQPAVHALTGLGQRHFYFRSGRCVVWLAANHREAASALEAALRFYR